MSASLKRERRTGGNNRRNAYHSHFRAAISRALRHTPQLSQNGTRLYRPISAHSPTNSLFRRRMNFFYPDTPATIDSLQPLQNNQSRRIYLDTLFSLFSVALSPLSLRFRRASSPRSLDSDCHVSTQVSHRKQTIGAHLTRHSQTLPNSTFRAAIANRAPHCSWVYSRNSRPDLISRAILTRQSCRVSALVTHRKHSIGVHLTRQRKWPFAVHLYRSLSLRQPCLSKRKMKYCHSSALLMRPEN